MRKIISLALLSVSFKAFAFHHWRVQTEALTLNPEIPSTLSNLDLGYKLDIQYNVNANLYASVNTIRYPHDRWSVGTTIGLTDAAGYVHPYAEVNYNRVPTNNNRRLPLVGYDLGVTVHIFKHIIPCVEFDNFFQKQKESVQVGLNVQLRHRFSVGGTFAWQPANGSNGVNVKISYSF